MLPAAAAAAFAAARRLLDDEAKVEALPAPVRKPAERARGKLRRARDRVGEAMRDARAEKEAAEIELTAEYRRRTGG